MLIFTLRRLGWTVLVIFFVSLVTFFLMHQAPGGPFDRGDKQVDARTLALLNARFGLDKPQYINRPLLRKLWAQGERSPAVLLRGYLDSQYGNYMIGAIQGKLGPSYRQRGKEVQDILREQWVYTLRLIVCGLLFAVLIGIPLGVVAAMRQNSSVDYLALLITTVGISVPSFVVGLLMIIVFGTNLGWITITGNNWHTWRPYLVPGLVLGLTPMSLITRITRVAVLEIKRQDYVRTARAKGLDESLVVLRHIFRNALIPIASLISPALVGLITGAVVIESVFGSPGIGRALVSAIFERDYSMIMGMTLVYTVVIVLINLLVDLGYGLLDPRIRSQG